MYMRHEQGVGSWLRREEDRKMHVLLKRRIKCRCRGLSDDDSRLAASSVQSNNLAAVNITQTSPPASIKSLNRPKMASPPMTAKRRRLNNATNTLSKPFVSPLKTADALKTPSKSRRSDKTATRNPPYVPSTLAHTIAPTTPVPLSKPQSAKSSAITPMRTNPVRKHAYSTPFAKRSDPAEQAVQKEITSLELQIKAVRNDIHALNQAAKYTSDTDNDLEELAVKWKLASQAAAEEIFGSVKERVNRMGGVEAWRDTEKQKYERSNGIGEFAEPEVEDDADCEFDSQGEELPEDEQEYRKREKRRLKHEAMEAADVDERVVEDETGPKQVWQQTGNGDDVSMELLAVHVKHTNCLQSFTIDMMLQSLNIELDVIGYDKQGQRWVS
jgi:Swi5-dependent recombination DNA repair protein 1